jgi:hypothetical protein
MSTSTSKHASEKRMQKLYGYLNGFEAVCYTGSSKSATLSAFKALYEDELRNLSLDPADTNSANKEFIFRSVDKFLTKYYSRMKCTSSSQTKRLAEDSKASSKELDRMLSKIMSGTDENPLYSFAVALITSDGCVKSVTEICDKCPWYLGPKVCMLWDRFSCEEGCPEADVFSFKIAEYKYLAVAMLGIAFWLMHFEGKTCNDLVTYHMLFEVVLTASKIFELMNPSGECRQEYINEANQLLTEEPLDHDSPTYKYYEGILDSVILDIKEGKKRYIRDIKNALEKNEEYIHSKYNPEKDDYTAMKGTAQSVFTGVHYSLLSSGLEVDLLKDLFQEFDDYVGYESTYLTWSPELEAKVKELATYSFEYVPNFRVILINNPGKFKPRIIHISDNPIQDRCSYIQHRLQSVIQSMRCDSSKDQDKGRSFLKKLTWEWYLSKQINKKGIYCFDFSNATDTLDQHFQYRVLEFVMGPEVAKFWDIVSRTDKYLQSVDGSYAKLTQRKGQPQGLLGSFEAFSLAHHFIFLMDMKMLGYEDHYSSDFYSLLGDDSVCNSIEPEYDLFDHSIIDGAGLHRSPMEMNHFGICESFAGFKINYDKSESVHHDSAEAKLDFAKVTFRNGQLFTPIPFRLAMRYSRQDEVSRIAIAIWRMERGDPSARRYLDIVLEGVDPIVGDILKSGVFPYLEGFKDERIYNSSWIARLKYAIALTFLRRSLDFLLLSDKNRDFGSGDELLKTWTKAKHQFKLKIGDIELNPNHKLVRILRENEQILNLLKEVFDLEDEEDKFMLLCFSSLGEDLLQGEFFDILSYLADTSRLLRLAKSSPKDVDLSTVFPTFDMNWMKTLQVFSQRFMTRGITKKPREQAIMFQEVRMTLEEVNDLLGEIPPVMEVALH